MIHALSITIFPALMILAAMTDVLAFRIPNWLTIVIALLFFPMAWLTGMPLAELGLHVAVGLGLFLVGFLLFSAGLFGGGDAKLLAAAGLWFGTTDTIPFLVYTVMAGGLLALAVGIWSALSIDWEIRDVGLFRKLRTLKPNVPYGLAFAVGAILAFKETWWMGPVG
jgi:prepilin peptidase CpaA